LDAELGPHFFANDGTGRDPRLCPGCSAGRLSLKLGKFGAFIGCSNYPVCRYTRSLIVEGEAESSIQETALGPEPATALPVTLKKGPYGHYVQLGEGDGDAKPKRVALPRSISPVDVDLETALRLLSLPRELGRHPETGEPIIAGIGRFGPYIKHGNTFKSLGIDDDVLTIGLNRAIVLLAEASPERRRGPQLLRELGAHPKGGSVGLYRGRYGPYVSHDGVIASLPRNGDPTTFSLEQALPLLAAQRDKRKGRRKTGKTASTKAAPAKAASRSKHVASVAAKRTRGGKKAGTPRATKKAPAKPSAQPGRQ